MLEDELLRERYRRYLEEHIELSARELRRTRGNDDFYAPALMYSRIFRSCLQFFEDQCRGNLLSVFRNLHEAGCIELITCSATHGYLPLLRTSRGAVAAQLRMGARTFQRVFKRPACGIWLPECGYYPGLEDLLKQTGFQYFTVESHGIQHADPRPPRGVYAPVACPNGVCAFGRDPASSRQVWSAHEGYPGDPDYRDFYRDIGFDTDLDYIAPFILDGKTRIHTGFKYYRITGQTDDKKPYRPRTAQQRARQHARDFILRKREQCRHGTPCQDIPPLIHAPFDAELFGHWWFEGPLWLEQLYRLLPRTAPEIRPATPSDYLDAHPRVHQAVPSGSSWGYKGYNEQWLSGENDHLLPHLHAAAEKMAELAQHYADASPPGPIEERALNQAGRNLLLAQSSDWPFILKTGTSAEYARKRVQDHFARFRYLTTHLESGTLDTTRLEALEELDNIFPDMDFRIFTEQGALP
jgi:1,4-alpha-glucan branching enzyme